MLKWSIRSLAAVLLTVSTLSDTYVVVNQPTSTTFKQFHSYDGFEKGFLADPYGFEVRNFVMDNFTPGMCITASLYVQPLGGGRPTSGRRTSGRRGGGRPTAGAANFWPSGRRTSGRRGGGRPGRGRLDVRRRGCWTSAATAADARRRASKPNRYGTMTKTFIL